MYLFHFCIFFSVAMTMCLNPWSTQRHLRTELDMNGVLMRSVHCTQDTGVGGGVEGWGGGLVFVFAFYQVIQLCQNRTK